MRNERLPLSIPEITAQVVAEAGGHERGLREVLGNFPNWLRPPGAIAFNYRKDLERQRRLNRVSSRRPHMERMPDGERVEDHSMRWLGENDMEFLFDVNEAMKRQGIKAEIVQQMDEFAREDPSEYDIRIDLLYRYVLTTFADLLQQGYDKQELTA